MLKTKEDIEREIEMQYRMMATAKAKQKSHDASRAEQGNMEEQLIGITIKQLVTEQKTAAE